MLWFLSLMYNLENIKKSFKKKEIKNKKMKNLQYNGYH